jgi:DNA-binding NarL/FixJ family response regulator
MIGRNIQYFRRIAVMARSCSVRLLRNWAVPRNVSPPMVNSGLGAAPRMLQVSPDSKILMFSHHDSASIVTASLNAGALGYVMKSDAGKDLMAGLLATSQGKQFVSAGVVVAGQT